MQSKEESVDRVDEKDFLGLSLLITRKSRMIMNE
jgi:hypothetical protein